MWRDGAVEWDIVVSRVRDEGVERNGAVENGIWGCGDGMWRAKDEGVDIKRWWCGDREMGCVE